MAYTGHPLFATSPTITPRIKASRLGGSTPGGSTAPLWVHVSASETTCTGGTIEGGGAIQPYKHLDYAWDFGEPANTDSFVSPVTGATVLTNSGQTGPEATHIYRTAGTYTVTLTARARTVLGAETYVTATTTSLIVNQVQVLAFPITTKGSYTLSFGGQTTTTLTAGHYGDTPKGSTKSQIIAALEALSTIGAGNVRPASGYQDQSAGGTFPEFHAIEFCGSLRATANALLTLNDVSLTNTHGITPKFRIYEGTAAGTAAGIVVTAPASELWVDSVAGADGNAGTIGSPKATFAALATFLQAGEGRVAYVKKGSTLSDVAIDLGGIPGSRITSYGSGAQPIYNGPSNGFSMFTNESVALPSTLTTLADRYSVRDVFLEDMALRPAGDGAGLDIISRSADPVRRSIQKGSLHLGISNIGASLVRISTQNEASYNEGFLAYKVTQHYGTAGRSDLLINRVRYTSFVACTMTGGGFDGTLAGVHVYPKCPEHLLIRGHSSSNTIYFNALNINTPDCEGDVNFNLVADCELWQVKNGMDWSDKLNNDTGTYPYGKYRNVVVGGCRIKAWEIGIWSQSQADLTVRDCQIQGCGAGPCMDGVKPNMEFELYRNDIAIFIPTHLTSGTLSSSMFRWSGTGHKSRVTECRFQWSPATTGNGLISFNNIAPDAKFTRSRFYMPPFLQFGLYPAPITTNILRNFNELFDASIIDNTTRTNSVTNPATNSWIGPIWAYPQERDMDAGDGETPDTTAPSQPGVITPSLITNTTARMTWVESTDNLWVTGYDTTLNGSPLANFGSYFANLTGLSPGTIYTFGVSARDYAGNVGTERTVSFQTTGGTPDTTPPTQPGEVTFSSITPSGFTATWGASTDAVGVTAYNLTLNGSSISSVATNTVVLGGLSPSTLYTLVITARDAAGNTSATRTDSVTTSSAGVGTVGSLDLMWMMYFGLGGEAVSQGTGPTWFTVAIAASDAQWTGARLESDAQWTGARLDGFPNV
jgi:PKD repeat protein